MDKQKLSYINLFSSPKTQKVWDLLRKCMFGQILEFCSHHSKLKKLSWVMKTGNKILLCSSWIFQWQDCCIGGSHNNVLSCHINWDCWGWVHFLCFISFLFRSTLSSILLSFSQHHTPTLFHHLSSSSHFSSPEESGASKIEKLSSWRGPVQLKTRADRRTWSVTGSLFCQFWVWPKDTVPLSFTHHWCCNGVASYLQLVLCFNRNKFCNHQV